MQPERGIVEGQRRAPPCLSLGIWAAELLLGAVGALTETHGLSSIGNQCFCWVSVLNISVNAKINDKQKICSTSHFFAHYYKQ